MKNNLFIIVMLVLFCLSVWIITFLAINYPEASPLNKPNIVLVLNQNKSNQQNY